MPEVWVASLLGDAKAPNFVLLVLLESEPLLPDRSASASMAGAQSACRSLMRDWLPGVAIPGFPQRGLRILDQGVRMYVLMYLCMYVCMHV